jgi:hypothetical protein
MRAGNARALAVVTATVSGGRTTVRTAVAGPAPLSWAALVRPGGPSGIFVVPGGLSGC